METEDHAGLIATLIPELDLPRIPQQNRSRQKRDALLAAASRLFEERGYDATTADDIAAAADVSIGTFYGYFRNKRQIFLALYAEYLEQILGLGITEIDFSSDPRQAIHQTVQRAFQHDASCIGIKRACVELLPRDPELASYHRKFNQIIYEQIMTAARRLEAEGLTWPEIDLETTCWVITQLLDHTQHVDFSPEQQPRRCAATADLIYHALFRC